MKKWNTVCILAALSASLLSVSEVHTQFGQHRCNVDFHAGTRTRCKREHTLSQSTPLILSMQSQSSTGEKTVCSYRGNVESVYLFVSGGWAGSWVRTKSAWWPAVVSSSSSMQVKSGGHVLSLVWCYCWCVSDLMWPELWIPKLLVSISLLIWNQSRPEHELIHSSDFIRDYQYLNMMLINLKANCVHVLRTSQGIHPQSICSIFYMRSNKKYGPYCFPINNWLRLVTEVHFSVALCFMYMACNLASFAIVR